MIGIYNLLNTIEKCWAGAFTQEHGIVHSRELNHQMSFLRIDPKALSQSLELKNVIAISAEYAQDLGPA